MTVILYVYAKIDGHIPPTKANERQEEDTILVVYMQALGML